MPPSFSWHLELSVRLCARTCWACGLPVCAVCCCNVTPPSCCCVQTCLLWSYMLLRCHLADLLTWLNCTRDTSNPVGASPELSVRTSILSAHTSVGSPVLFYCCTLSQRTFVIFALLHVVKIVNSGKVDISITMRFCMGRLLNYLQ